MSAKELAQSITEWIAKNADESALLSSGTELPIDGMALLGHIVSLNVATKEEITQWANDALA
jgi:hypothetical protein